MTWSALIKALAAALGLVRDFLMFRAGKDRATAAQAEEEADAKAKMQAAAGRAGSMSDAEFADVLRKNGL